MAKKMKFLNEGQELIVATDPAAPTAIITNAANRRLVITNIILCNFNNIAVTVDLWHIPDNAGALGDVADKHRLLDRQDLSLAAGESLFIGPDEIKCIMEGTNELLSAAASVANKVSIHVYGYEIDTS